jgi:hemoglobin
VVVNTPGQPGSTLFARLGGMDGVRALVDELVVRLASDPRVEERFARSDFRRFKARLVVQLCEVVGGPCRYRGRPLAEAHAGLGISAAEFDVFLDDVRAAASAVGASQREREELVRLLRGLESEVVGR